MDLLTLDFETHYSSDYSLSKLTTEAYINSPLFEVIGVSVKHNGKPTEWFSGTESNTRQFLAQFDWGNAGLVAHNSMFDAAILAWRFGIKPRFIFDTLSMARGLVGMQTSCALKKLAEFYDLSTRKGDAVQQTLGMRRMDFTPAHLRLYIGDYCANDTELCYELFRKLYPLTQKSELRLIDWTVRAFVEPSLRVDAGVIQDELVSYRARMQHLLANCGVTDAAELRSDSRMADLLVALGVSPPTKENANGETKYAFAKADLEFTDLLDDPDERVVALVEARLGLKSSIVLSRLERFRDIATRGPLCVPLMYCGATTTKRFSGADKINLQNLPRNKPGQPSALRQAIQSRPGEVIIVADQSAIECRVQAWQSGQRDMVELFRRGEDVYCDQGPAIYGRAITKTDAVERFVCKVTVLSAQYGVGAPRLQSALKTSARQFGIPLEDDSLEFADRVVKAYRNKNRAIVGFWNQAEEALDVLSKGIKMQLGPYRIENHKLYLPNGTHLYYPELRMRHNAETRRNEWTYKRMRGRALTETRIHAPMLTENLAQAVSRIAMTDAMRGIMERYTIAFTVHDELVCTVPEREQDDAVAFIKHVMTQSPKWAPDLPLAVEVGTGHNYAEAK